MSSNLDLVRLIYAGWERGDFSSAEWAHPEIEFVLADGPSPGRWTGLAGMAAGWRDVLSSWDGYRVAAEEFRELDDERVVVFLHVSGSGKTSGLQLGRVRARGGNIFHVRNGKVTRLVVYFDHQLALADLGLAPEAARPGRESDRPQQ